MLKFLTLGRFTVFLIAFTFSSLFYLLLFHPFYYTTTISEEYHDPYEVYIPSILPPITPITINILWWIHNPNSEEPRPPSFIRSSCLPPEVKCYFNMNQSNFAYADMVVFPPRFPEPIESDGVATAIKRLNEERKKINEERERKKQTKQTWMVHTLESPINDGSTMNPRFMRFFNYTSNYQWSSDVPDTYYYRMMWEHKKTLDFVFNMPVPIEQKTKEAPIVWYASNCGSGNGRENYVVTLQKYIKVHSYGKCLTNIAEQPGDDMWKVITRYKFYLAFENTLCEDYVTEKFWRTLDAGIVPVVYGAPNFNRRFQLTPKSVINANDYASPKELAEYLNYLDKNDTAYKEYLSYKYDHKLNPSFEQLMNASPCKEEYMFANICKFAAEIEWGHKKVDRRNGLRTDTSCSRNKFFVP